MSARRGILLTPGDVSILLSALDSLAYEHDPDRNDAMGVGTRREESLASRLSALFPKLPGYDPSAHDKERRAIRDTYR